MSWSREPSCGPAAEEGALPRSGEAGGRGGEDSDEYEDEDMTSESDLGEMICIEPELGTI